MKYSSRLKKKKNYSSVMGVLIEHREKRRENKRVLREQKNNFVTFSDLTSVQITHRGEMAEKHHI